MEVSIFIGEVSREAFSGPARYGRSLVLGLAERGIGCDVHTYRWESGNRNQPNVNVRVYTPIVSIGNLQISPSLARSAFAGVKDIVQVHGVRNFQCEIGALTSTLQNRPLVIVPHGSLLGYKRAFSGRGGRWLSAAYDIATVRASTRSASAIVVTSSIEEEDAMEFGIPREKVVRIPYGMSLPPGEPVEAKPGARETKIVLTVTRLTAKNNLEFLVRGFARALKGGARLHLLVVGGVKASGFNPEETGYHRRLLNLVSELQVADSVTFAGWKTETELWEIYRGADVFAWTSRYDNFARALVEAAWFGLPIVSTPVGVAPDLLAHGQGGRLVKHDDYEGLANALVYLAEERTPTVMEAQENRDKAAGYTVEKMVTGYIELYQRLVAEQSG